MDKKVILDKTKKYVLRALKIRRALKTFFAFVIGISTGIVTYRQLYSDTDSKSISICFAIIVDAATISLALIVRFIIGKVKRLGIRLFNKTKKFIITKGINNMNDRISKLVEIMFDDIPYSLEASEAQNKIESALEAEYTKLREKLPEGEALDEVLSEYGKLAKMAHLAGYSEEQAKAWRNAGDATELKSAKKMIRRQRRLIYLSSALCMAVLM